MLQHPDSTTVVTSAAAARLPAGRLLIKHVKTIGPSSSSSRFLLETRRVDMAEPPAKRKCEPKARTKFQEGWKKGRVWLEYDEVAMSMSCSWCKTFFTRKALAAGHRRDAWIVGCKRLKIEVVREHECSKGHRDASEAHRTAQSVQREGGFFARQMQRRDDAAV